MESGGLRGPRFRVGSRGPRRAADLVPICIWRPGEMGPTRAGEGSLLSSAQIQFHQEAPFRDNVSPKIWGPRGPLKLTQKSDHENSSAILGSVHKLSEGRSPRRSGGRAHPGLMSPRGGASQRNGAACSGCTCPPGRRPFPWELPACVGAFGAGVSWASSVRMSGAVLSLAFWALESPRCLM